MPLSLITHMGPWSLTCPELQFFQSTNMNQGSYKVGEKKSPYTAWFSVKS